MFTKILVWTFRILVGGLFVFSGFVKVNDIVGFAIKLDKYWFAFEAATGIGFSALTNVSVLMSAVFSILETALGFFLLLGIWRKFTTWALLLMIIFFTFLTAWAAITKSVPDCGCFGSAFTIPSWTSFSKDVVLLGMIGFLYINAGYIEPIFKRPRSMSHILGSSITLIITLFTLYTYFYLPLLDFRPSKVGAQFDEIIEMDLNTGETPLEGYIPIEEKCSGARPFEGRTMFVVMKDMTYLDKDDFNQVLLTVKDAEKLGIVSYGMTTTNTDVADKLAAGNGLDLCITPQDQDFIKTIIRSNLGYILLKDGKIMAKWSSANTPDKADLEAVLNE